MPLLREHPGAKIVIPSIDKIALRITDITFSVIIIIKQRGPTARVRQYAQIIEHIRNETFTSNM